MPYSHLTFKDRNVIYRMRFEGHSQSTIAKALGKHKSTISRELKRNTSAWNTRYFPIPADLQAGARLLSRVTRPKTGYRRLMRYVAEHLERSWSPAQISGRLRMVDFQDDSRMQISAQHIYRWIWSDSERTVYYKKFMRHAGKKRRKPYGSPAHRGQIKNRISIDERPEIVDTRSRIGDWEGDTIQGRYHRSYVLTCVDRASLYLIARKMPNKKAATLKDAMQQGFRHISRSNIHTLTLDNGKEFAQHQDIAKYLHADVYFAHPYSSWERATNENMNGLLRQYLPKKEDFSKLSNKSLARIIRSLNNRPRKCLGYRTPCEVFNSPGVALRM